MIGIMISCVKLVDQEKYEEVYKGEFWKQAEGLGCTLFSCYIFGLNLHREQLLILSFKHRSR